MNEAASIRDWLPVVNSVAIVVVVLAYLWDRRAMRLAIGAIPAMMENHQLRESGARLESRLDEEVRALRLEYEKGRAEVIRHVDTVKADLIEAEKRRIDQSRHFVLAEESRNETNRKILVAVQRSGRKVDWLMRVMEQRPCVLAGSCEHDAAPLPPPPRFEDVEVPEEGEGDA